VHAAGFELDVRICHLPIREMYMSIFSGSARRGSLGIVNGCPTFTAACCISRLWALAVFTLDSQRKRF
jgi:hypothetical protein